MAQHLVVTGLFDVEDLTLERQDGLEAAIAALFCSAACRFTLDQVKFAALRVALGAVGKLAGQAAAVESSFAAGQVAGFAGCFPGAGSVDGLVDDFLGNRGVLFEEGAQAFVHEGLYRAGDIGVELALGLALELGLREFDTDYGYQSLADVVAGEILLQVFEES